MSTIDASYASSRDLALLSNVFVPSYRFVNDEFSAQLDTYLQGDVNIGASNTGYTLKINGNPYVQVTLSDWAKAPAIASVDMSGYKLVDIASSRSTDQTGGGAAISFYGDRDTGIYSPSDGVVGILTNNVSGLIISSGGISNRATTSNSIGNITLSAGSVFLPNGMTLSGFNIIGSTINVCGALVTASGITNPSNTTNRIAGISLSNGNISNDTNSDNFIGGVRLQGGRITTQVFVGLVNDYDQKNYGGGIYFEDGKLMVNVDPSGVATGPFQNLSALLGVGRFNVSTGDVRNMSAGSTEWNSEYSVFGAINASGAALGIGYDTTNGISRIVSAKPGTGLRDMTLVASTLCLAVTTLNVCGQIFNPSTSVNSIGGVSLSNYLVGGVSISGGGIYTPNFSTINTIGGVTIASQTVSANIFNTGGSTDQSTVGGVKFKDSNITADGNNHNIGGLLIGNSRIAPPSAGNRRVMFGSVAGTGTSTGVDSIAIGTRAGFSNQGTNSIAIGVSSGLTNQADNVIAIGNQAGVSGQGVTFVEGAVAGFSVAIGGSAGSNSQSSSAIAIGGACGRDFQGFASIAIGNNTGRENQRLRAIAIGDHAGVVNQSGLAVAIGHNAGCNAQGEHSIAIGAYAGCNSQRANSIMLNATGAEISNAYQTTSGFYVAPVRSDTTDNVTSFGVLAYNQTTREIVDVKTGSVTLGTNVTIRNDGTITAPTRSSIGGVTLGSGALSGVTSISASGTISGGTVLATTISAGGPSYVGGVILQNSNTIMNNITVSVITSTTTISAGYASSNVVGGVSLSSAQIVATGANNRIGDVIFNAGALSGITNISASGTFSVNTISAGNATANTIGGVSLSSAQIHASNANNRIGNVIFNGGALTGITSISAAGTISAGMIIVSNISAGYASSNVIGGVSLSSAQIHASNANNRIGNVIFNAGALSGITSINATGTISAARVEANTAKIGGTDFFSSGDVTTTGVITAGALNATGVSTIGGVVLQEGNITISGITGDIKFEGNMSNLTGTSNNIGGVTVGPYVGGVLSSTGIVTLSRLAFYGPNRVELNTSNATLNISGNLSNVSATTNTIGGVTLNAGITNMSAIVFYGVGGVTLSASGPVLNVSGSVSNASITENYIGGVIMRNSNVLVNSITAGNSVIGGMTLSGGALTTGSGSNSVGGVTLSGGALTTGSGSNSVGGVTLNGGALTTGAGSNFVGGVTLNAGAMSGITSISATGTISAGTVLATTISVGGVTLNGGALTFSNATVSISATGSTFTVSGNISNASNTSNIIGGVTLSASFIVPNFDGNQIAIGTSAKKGGIQSINIGCNAGTTTGGAAAIAIGFNSANSGQSAHAVAIGNGAGGQGQREYSIAIGHSAGLCNQMANSIMLNATGAEINTAYQTTSGFYVAPVRAVPTSDIVIYSGMAYNPTTREIVNASGGNVVIGGVRLAGGSIYGTVVSTTEISGNITNDEQTSNFIGGVTIGVKVGDQAPYSLESGKITLSSLIFYGTGAVTLSANGSTLSLSGNISNASTTSNNIGGVTLSNSVVSATTLSGTRVVVTSISATGTISAGTVLATTISAGSTSYVGDVTFNAGTITTSSAKIGLTGTPCNYRVNIAGTGGTNGFVSFYNSAVGVPYVGLGYDATLDGLSFRTNYGTTDLNRTAIFIKRDSDPPRVGIANTDPQYVLDVSGNGVRIANNNATGVTTGLFLESGLGTGSQSTNNYALVSFSTRGAGGGDVVQSLFGIYEGGNYGLSVKNSNVSSSTTVLRMDTTNSRVGVGTMSPEYTLDVSGTANVTSNLRVVGTITGLTTISAGGPSYVGGVTLSGGALTTGSGSNSVGGVTLNAGALTTGSGSNSVGGVTLNAGAMSGITSISATGTISAGRVLATTISAGGPSYVGGVTLNGGTITTTTLNATNAVFGSGNQVSITSTGVNLGTGAKFDSLVASSNTIGGVTLENRTITTNGNLVTSNGTMSNFATTSNNIGGVTLNTGITTLSQLVFKGVGGVTLSASGPVLNISGSISNSSIADNYIGGVIIRNSNVLVNSITAGNSVIGGVTLSGGTITGNIVTLTISVGSPSYVGGVTLSGGGLYNVTSISASGTISAGMVLATTISAGSRSFIGGVTLSGGALTNVTSISATGTISAGTVLATTISAGSRSFIGGVTLSGGALTNVTSISATDTISAGTVLATTITAGGSSTIGAVTLNSGNLTNVSTINNSTVGGVQLSNGYIVPVGVTQISIGSGAYRGGAGSIAIGQLAGSLGELSESSIAIGYTAGGGTQGANSIAIGSEAAGGGAQGCNSIAIGNRAGFLSQAANSIILGDLERANTNGFFVSQVRNVVDSGYAVLAYNTGTKEIVNVSNAGATVGGVTLINSNITTNAGGSNSVGGVTLNAGALTTGSGSNSIGGVTLNNRTISNVTTIQATNGSSSIGGVTLNLGSITTVTSISATGTISAGTVLATTISAGGPSYVGGVVLQNSNTIMNNITVNVITSTTTISAGYASSNVVGGVSLSSAQIVATGANNRIGDVIFNAGALSGITSISATGTISAGRVLATSISAGKLGLSNLTSESANTNILSINTTTNEVSYTGNYVKGITAGTGITISPAGPGATGVVTITATGGGGGSGTVTSVTSANANITVANGTTTPQLTLNNNLSLTTITTGTGSNYIGGVTLNGGALTSGSSSAGWIEETNGIPTTANWRSVACSGNGNTLMACYPLGYAYSKTGSTAWIADSTVVGPVDYTSVACSRDGGTMITGVNGQHVYVKTPTQGWAAQSIGLVSWTSVACSADATTLMACAYGGTIKVKVGAGAWESQTITGASTADWQSVACSGNGNTLMACSIGATGRVYVKVGAGAWEPQTLGGVTTAVWTSVACSSDGNTLIACSSGATGRVYVKVGAGAWEPQTLAGVTTANWKSVSCSSDGNTLIACSSGTTGNVYIKNYTDQWILSTSIGNADWQSVSCSENGETLIVCSGGSTGEVYVLKFGFVITKTTSSIGGVTLNGGSISNASTSSNSIGGFAIGQGTSYQVYNNATLTAVTSIGTGKFVGVASDSTGTKLITAGENTRIYTYNPTNGWSTIPSTGGNPGAANWGAVASDSTGTKLFVAAYSGGYIWRSIDSGSNWTNNNNASGIQSWNGLACSSDGNRVVASVFGGFIYTSTNAGLNWSTNLSSSGNRSWTRVASDTTGDKLVACVGVTPGYIYTSSNGGFSWDQRTYQGLRDWRALASSSDGSKLAAGVYGGYIYTSTDYGQSWTTNGKSSGARNWYSITSDSTGNYLVACVLGGGVYTSRSAGVEWVKSTGIPDKQWYNIASSSDGMKIIAGELTNAYTGTVSVVTTYSTNRPIISPNSTTCNINIGGNNSTVGTYTSGTLSVAIGYNAAILSQGSYAIGIGAAAGYNNQGTYGIAFGSEAGQYGQGIQAVAIGLNAGRNDQGSQTVALGAACGQLDQSSGSVGIGHGAGNFRQGGNAVSIGFMYNGTSNQTNQGESAISIGFIAGNISQGSNSIAIGHGAGKTSQGSVATEFSTTGRAYAIGSNAGCSNQGSESIGIGSLAGSNNQSHSAVAIGRNAASVSQGIGAIAIGWDAGTTSQPEGAIAIGKSAGNTAGAKTGTYSIAIGQNAGGGGDRSITIGANAGAEGAAANTIVINATAGDFADKIYKTQTSSLFVAPIRNVPGGLPANFKNMAYNPTTKEIIYYG